MQRTVNNLNVSPEIPEERGEHVKTSSMPDAVISAVHHLVDLSGVSPVAFHSPLVAQLHDVHAKKM